MKIVITTKNIELHSNLRKYIQGKIENLEKFSKIFQQEQIYSLKKGKPNVEAWMEIGRETFHHQKGNIFRVECQMHFPGKSIRAEAISKNLRQAIGEVKDELQREIKKYKERIISLAKRRTRSFKKELHLTKEARFYRKGRIREEGI